MSTAFELLFIVVPALLYARGYRALRERTRVNHGVSRARATVFAAGLAVLAVALLSPLDRIAEDLFSAHMVQHLLLMLGAAPLCVLGAPLLPMLWAFPLSRRRAAAMWWRRSSFTRGVVHGATNPAVVFIAQMVALWFWHFPRPYQAAIEHDWIHALEHISFLGTASLFWWVVFQPIGRRRASEGATILMLGGTLLQSGALGAVLMFAKSPWYPILAAGASRWGTTLLEDQQLAGLLMWIPASAVYVAATAWVFVRWMRLDERRPSPEHAPVRVSRPTSTVGGAI
ncbi:MAG: cytochrome c oxidase assembly protein [Gemmatimonadaceae bacterium]